MLLLDSEAISALAHGPAARRERVQDDRRERKPPDPLGGPLGTDKRHGMPHTFSVYDRKKVLNSRCPNRLDTQVSKLFSGFSGNNCA